MFTVEFPVIHQRVRSQQDGAGDLFRMRDACIQIASSWLHSDLGFGLIFWHSVEYFEYGAAMRYISRTFLM